MSDHRRFSNDAPLKDIIDKLMKAYGLEHRMKEMDVINAWPDLMGAAVAHRTKELKIKEKVLYVWMDSSVMRDELQHGKQIIIDRVNQKAGYEMITDIWFG
jgi:predicted nucleic acid-binding Zn ribbon protein